MEFGNWPSLNPGLGLLHEQGQLLHEQGYGLDLIPNAQHTTQLPGAQQHTWPSAEVMRCHTRLALHSEAMINPAQDPAHALELGKGHEWQVACAKRFSTIKGCNHDTHHRLAHTVRPIQNLAGAEVANCCWCFTHTSQKDHHMKVCQ
jgi:hypothetical protein